ncbi:alginate export family protein [Armatimonas rosea]|uniref:Alginate export domain-containing protein n=1 Tax=Armatimonas rosea TaxID=685828 RepID=A0A7W9ST38_ARMRO|nr:alginate export family protein [Armatimonas rosea]MBB6051449.1 hypothetical protein [Armatimonas rosea]
MKHSWAIIALLGSCASVHAQTTESGEWKYTGSLRVRLESWDWFKPADATKQNQYNYVGSILRYGADGKVGNSPVKLELAAPLLLGLPTNASAPLPAGSLGVGAVYRAQNGSQNGSVFLKQGFFVGKAAEGALKVGRFEFDEGKETIPTDPAMAFTKSSQVAARLIGTVGWSHVGRSFDGFTWSRTEKSANTTLLAAMPTQGVYDLDGQNTLTKVKVASLSHTKLYKNGEDRLFLIGYEDTRGLVKTDDNPTAAKDTNPIRLATLGGNLLGTFPTPFGPGDGLLWAAVQSGQWGSQRANANSWTAQVAVHPGFGKKNDLAVRGGYYYASGDSNPNDNQHGTFYPILNTPRLFARTPFFAEANLKDAFVSVTGKVGSKLALRGDYHLLQLANANDLWYQSGSPFNNTAFGLTGRPSSGSHNLADLIDLSADMTLSKSTTASFYFGQMLGKEIVKSIYPDSKGSFGYMEVNYKF